MFGVGTYMHILVKLVVSVVLEVCAHMCAVLSTGEQFGSQRAPSGHGRAVHALCSLPARTKDKGC